MKNTAFFDVANNLLHSRRSKMEQREKVLTDTHAKLNGLLLKTYVDSKDKASIDEIFFLFFGVNFDLFYDKVKFENYNQRQASELDQYKKVQSMTVEEYYHEYFTPKPVINMQDKMLLYPIAPQDAYSIECYERFPMGKEQETLEKKMNESFLNRPCDFPVSTVKASSEDKTKVDFVPKINGDNQLIEERLKQLRIQISQYKQMPNELGGALVIEAQDKFNRLKKWLN